MQQPKLWFKNLLIYRITKPLNLSKLPKQLAENAFHPCGSGDRSKFGWSKPLASEDLFYFRHGNQFLLRSLLEEKILPTSVINQSLAERLQDLEVKQGRKLSKVEKQSLKEDVIASLLPRAFSKYRFTQLWIDEDQQLIYINTASTKRAEESLGLLRKSLGSLPVEPLSFALEIPQVMRNWLLKKSPKWLEILDSAELSGGVEEGIIRCKQQDLTADEILAILQTGKGISQLSLNWEEHLSFTLKSNGSLSNLKFASAMMEHNDDFDSTDEAGRLGADFVLMTGALQKLTQNLLKEFGGEKAKK